MYLFSFQSLVYFSFNLRLLENVMYCSSPIMLDEKVNVS